MHDDKAPPSTGPEPPRQNNQNLPPTLESRQSEHDLQRIRKLAIAVIIIGIFTLLSMNFLMMTYGLLCVASGIGLYRLQRWGYIILNVLAVPTIFAPVVVPQIIMSLPPIEQYMARHYLALTESAVVLLVGAALGLVCLAVFIGGVIMFRTKRVRALLQ